MLCIASSRHITKSQSRAHDVVCLRSWTRMRMRSPQWISSLWLNTSEVLTFEAMSARTHLCIYRNVLSSGALFSSLSSFRNIISHHVAERRTFFPSVPLLCLYYIICHVFIFLFFYFSFRPFFFAVRFYISFSDNQTSFILCVWIPCTLYFCGEISFPFYSIHYISIQHTHTHAVTIMMLTKCETKRTWMLQSAHLINRCCVEKSLESLGCIFIMIARMQCTKFISHWHYSSCLITTVPFAVAWKMAEFSTLITYLAQKKWEKRTQLITSKSKIFSIYFNCMFLNRHNSLIVFSRRFFMGASLQ